MKYSSLKPFYVTPEGICHRHLIKRKVGPDTYELDTGDFKIGGKITGNVCWSYLLSLRPHSTFKQVVHT